MLALSGCTIDLSNLFGSPQPLNVAAVETEVASVRQLPLLHPIPYQVLDAAQLKAKLAEMNAAQTNASQSDAAEKVLQFLGLIPEGMNLQSFMDGLYGEQILGFYDPEEGKLYLVDRRGFGAEEEITVAHELVHGLTDQHFDLKRFDSPAFQGDDDAYSAADCLIEGDASLGETLYMTESGQNLGSLLGILFSSVTQDSSQLDAAPAYIRDSLLFPYQSGLAFVQALYDDGGWTEVDRAYRDPPSSTEQIMHPEKYILGNDPPLPVTFTPTPEGLDSWTLVYENVLGEFDFASWFRTFLPSEKADLAAAGWGGSRYQLWQKEGSRSFLMETLWDTPKDAQEAEQALQVWVSKRFPGTASAQGALFWQEGQGQVTVLAMEGAALRLASAPTRALAESLLQQLP
jgi:hypothetical protein